MKCLKTICITFAVIAFHVSSFGAVEAGGPNTVSTLADALKEIPAAEIGANKVLIYTETGEDLSLPAVASALALPEISERFHRTQFWFGDVGTLALRDITVLNVTNESLQISPADVEHLKPLPYLLGTLTSAQLEKLGHEGLSYADFSPNQQSLFTAILPDPFEVAGSSVGLMTLSSDQVRASVKLSANLQDSLLVSLPAGGTLVVHPPHNPEDDLMLVRPNGRRATIPVQKQIQQRLRHLEPSSLKLGDLKWEARELDSKVSMVGAATVTDLVNVVAHSTGLELYADPRYGVRNILMFGDIGTPKTARDVLKAISVAVGATWRQVGPAYVLTDDIQGLASRHALISDFAVSWSAYLQHLDDQNAVHLSNVDWLSSLQFAPGDATALTHVQAETLVSSGSNSLAWKDLASAQQAAITTKLTPTHPDDFSAYLTAARQSLTEDTPVGVQLEVKFSLMIPGGARVRIGDDYTVQHPKEAPVTPGKPTEHSKLGINAVLCSPRTPDEVRSIFDRVCKAGVKSVFLNVFTNGETFFSNTTAPPNSDVSRDVLKTALAEGSVRGVAVYAVVDLLRWRRQLSISRPWPSSLAEDLTVTLETPASKIQRLQSDNFVVPEEPNATDAWASPLDPQVRLEVRSLVGELAAQKGIKGLLFQDIIPPGYHGENFDAKPFGMQLGYQESSRLAYLRKYYIDPIDIDVSGSILIGIPDNTTPSTIGVSIPTFPDSPMSDLLNWRDFRHSAVLSLLEECYSSAHVASPDMPIFIREPTFGEFCYPWSSGTKLIDYSPTALPSERSSQIPNGGVVVYTPGVSSDIHWVSSVDTSKTAIVLLDLLHSEQEDGLTTALSRAEGYFTHADNNIGQ